MGVDVYSISGRENERFRIKLEATQVKGSWGYGDIFIYTHQEKESSKTMALGGDYSSWVRRSFCFFWLYTGIAFLGWNIPSIVS